MIYTLTFNPSLDYIVSVNDFELGKTNRTASEQMLAGGKGINVSTVLKNLGVENTALGFIAGFTGKELERMVIESGLNCDFITLEKGFSRINVKMKDFDGTEINGMGPVIDKQAIEKLKKQLHTLRKGDILVLAGSIPKFVDDFSSNTESFHDSRELQETMPHSEKSDFINFSYKDILQELDGKGIEFVVDATKDLLLNVLEFHPFLIKPNNHELGELFHVELKTRESVIPYAKKLQEMGARNVLISMAGEGAVLLDENGKVSMLPAPQGTLVNAVGAGDSMVAGFLAGWLETHDFSHAFQMGVAAGSASAFSELLATEEEIRKLYDRFCPMMIF